MVSSTARGWQKSRPVSLVDGEAGPSTGPEQTPVFEDRKLRVRAASGQDRRASSQSRSRSSVSPRSPREVLPGKVVAALEGHQDWFIIGGQAVRCYVPYRPSHDVDFGVGQAKASETLIRRLKRAGQVAVKEKGADTVHVDFEGIDISVFVLPQLQAHTAGNVLTLTGLLATKLHALLDRGVRRDFFDLYVLLQLEGGGVLSAIDALSTVYQAKVNRGLMLRALSYFDEADREAKLPGEGPRDWSKVKHFFTKAVGALVVPPTEPLTIQGRRVDISRLSTENQPVPKRKRSKRSG